MIELNNMLLININATDDDHALMCSIHTVVGQLNKHSTNKQNLGILQKCDYNN